MRLLKVAVVENDDLKEFIKDGTCTSIENLDYYDAQDFDYAQTALVDADNKFILYWNDNCHSNPEQYIDAFTDGLLYANVEYTIEKIVMSYDELKQYNGKKYR